MKLGKRTRRFLLYPLLLASGCHTLLTGSPVPIWHIEHLSSPLPVKAIVPGGLILSDGRIKKPPLAKRLPTDDPLMLAAVKNGVEITADGKVFGLLWLNRVCGNDPCAWDRRRVDLALLAAILLPDNLDDSSLPAEVIAVIQEHNHHLADYVRPRRFDKGRINIFDLTRMHAIEEEVEYARRRPERKAKQERWRWTFPVND